MARSRMLPLLPGWRRSVGAMDTEWPSATITAMAIPTFSFCSWRSYALYRNRGNGTFDDATDLAGLSGASRLADFGGVWRS